MQHLYLMGQCLRGVQTVKVSLDIETLLEKSLNLNPLRLVVVITILF